MGNLSLYYKIVGAFGLGLLVVVLVHLLDYRASEKLVASFQEVDEMHEILFRLEEARSLLKDVQRAHRGYAISGQEEFLEPYEQAVEQLPALLLQLEQDLRHHPPQQADFSLLQQLISRKLAFAEASIGQLRQGDKIQALQEIGQGKQYFDQAESILDKMWTREQQHLNAVEQQAALNISKNRQIVLLALFSSSLLLLLALRRIVYDIKQIQQLQHNLEGANLNLTSYNTELGSLNSALEENQQQLLQVQQALEQREEQLLEAQAISKTGSFDWRIGENTVRYTKEYARIFRIGEAEIYTYQGFLSRLHPQDREHVDSVVKDAIKNHRAYQVVYRLNFPDQLLYVQVNGRPYFKDGELLGILGTVADVTSFKEAERKLSEAQLALEKANRELEQANAELGTFSYSISHDLRAPLRAISGYSTILKEEFGHVLGEKGSELTDIVRLNANRLGALIWGLLEFAKLGKKAIDKRTVDMQQLLQQVLADKQLKEGTLLSVDDMEPVQGDPVLLRQVWENLIGNAIKFSANKAVPHISIGYSREAGWQVFCVKDNGVGFDPAYAQQLFQVFKRLHADTDFEGTGVGLAIARRIVEGHSGKIWAEARPGEGATFYFSLPVEEV